MKTRIRTKQISIEKAIEMVMTDIKLVHIKTLEDLMIASMSNSKIPFDLIVNEVNKRNSQ